MSVHAIGGVRTWFWSPAMKVALRFDGVPRAAPVLNNARAFSGMSMGMMVAGVVAGTFAETCEGRGACQLSEATGRIGRTAVASQTNGAHQCAWRWWHGVLAGKRILQATSQVSQAAAAEAVW